MKTSELSRLPLAAGWAARPGADQDVVLASRVRLARNLAEYPFPHAAGPDALEAANERVLTALRSELTPEPFGADSFELDSGSLSRLERSFLRERCMVDEPLPDRLLVTADERVMAHVGGSDHLRLVVLEPGVGLQQALSTARAMDVALETELNFAVAMDWGYLSSEITNLGAALRASVLVHVPALAALGRLATMSSSMANSGYELVPFFSDESIGSEEEKPTLDSSLCLLRNLTSLGSDEEAIITKLEEYASKLVHYERAAREELETAQSEETADSANRALGILRFARSLSAVEARSLVSHLRLGVVAGLVRHVAVETVTTLLLANQDSHIARRTGEGDGEDIDTVRARVFRDMLVS